MNCQATQLEFDYGNRGPSPWNVYRTNKIRVWWNDGNLFYSRCYISSKDGSVSGPIEHEFEDNATALHVAKQIHWGCCGWSANSLDLARLVFKISEFLTPDTN